MLTPDRLVLPLPALPRHSTSRHVGAMLAPLRFGEYLRERNLITDEQLLAALASHWSERRCSIGRTLVELGILPLDLVEAEARAYHDELDVVEVDLGDTEPDTVDSELAD